MTELSAEFVTMAAMLCGRCGHERRYHGRRGAGACRVGRVTELGRILGRRDESCPCKRFVIRRRAEPSA